MIDDLEQTLATSGDGLDVTAQARLASAKLSAQRFLVEATALVMPDDDDG